jgi:hypothetical protein
MSRDNSTGKNKEFYELGKKMFDRLNPPGTPAFKPYPPKRQAQDDDDDTQVYAKPWVGLTDEEINSWEDKLMFFNMTTALEVVPTVAQFARFVETKLRSKYS